MARLLQLTDPEKINQRLAETLYSEGPFIVHAVKGDCAIMVRNGDRLEAGTRYSIHVTGRVIRENMWMFGELADVRKTCDHLNHLAARGEIKWNGEEWDTADQNHTQESRDESPFTAASKPSLYDTPNRVPIKCEGCVWLAAPYAKTSGCGAEGGKCDRAKTQDLADCWREADDRGDLERRLLGLVEAVDQQDLGRGVVQVFGQVLPDGRDERQWVFLGPGRSFNKEFMSSDPRYYVDRLSSWMEYYVVDSNTEENMCACNTQEDADLIAQALNAFPNP